MRTCTFFGHADAPDGIRGALLTEIFRLIEHELVTDFYIGTHGSFDRMAYSAVKEAKNLYPHIRYYCVLSYLPASNESYSIDHTLYPEGIEAIPKRYAIVWRNRWMLAKSDYVITYVTHSWGNAAKFKKMAENQKKTVINLSKYMH